MWVKKESLLAYYEKAKQEVEQADNCVYEITHKHIKQQIVEYKKGLEQVTKQFNSVSSGNVKKRNDINALRKERTLYDHIFKTLEYQILDQEKKLYILIEKNQEQEAVITENEENLLNITELVSKNKYEDFYKIIEEEKKKYIEDLKTLKKGNKDEDNIYKEQKNVHALHFNKRTVNANDVNIEKFVNKTKEEQDACEDGSTIKFYDELFVEFRIHTTDEDYDLIEKYIINGDELNEELYRDFVEMENQYEDLKGEYENMVKIVDKHEEQSISTAITKNHKENEPEIDTNETTITLNKLIVI